MTEKVAEMTEKVVEMTEKVVEMIWPTFYETIK